MIHTLQQIVVHDDEAGKRPAEYSKLGSVFARELKARRYISVLITICIGFWYAEPNG